MNFSEAHLSHKEADKAQNTFSVLSYRESPDQNPFVPFVPLCGIRRIIAKIISPEEARYGDGFCQCRRNVQSQY
jgi:hypothetical protein